MSLDSPLGTRAGIAGVGENGGREQRGQTIASGSGGEVLYTMFQHIMVFQTPPYWHWALRSSAASSALLVLPFHSSFFSSFYSLRAHSLISHAPYPCSLSIHQPRRNERKGFATHGGALDQVRRIREPLGYYHAVLRDTAALPGVSPTCSGSRAQADLAEDIQESVKIVPLTLLANIYKLIVLRRLP